MQQVGQVFWLAQAREPQWEQPELLINAIQRKAALFQLCFLYPPFHQPKYAILNSVKRVRIFLLLSQLSSFIAFLPFLRGGRGKGFVPFSVQTSGSLTESIDIKVKWRKREEELGCREFKEILQNHKLYLQQIGKQFRSPVSRSSTIIKRSSLLILQMPMIPIDTEPERSWTSYKHKSGGKHCSEDLLT